MTISLTLKVNGNYRATVVHKVNGEQHGEPLQVVQGDQGYVPFQHGSTNTYEITEEYLGEKTQGADAPAQAKPE